MEHRRQTPESDQSAQRLRVRVLRCEWFGLESPSSSVAQGPQIYQADKSRLVCGSGGMLMEVSARYPALSLSD